MLKLQTIIKKLKWKIHGISFNGKKTSIIKINFSNQVNFLSRSDFQKSLTNQDFHKLIDLKESILTSNESSYEVYSFLRILNLQIHRLKVAEYSLVNSEMTDIHKEYNKLNNLLQSIKTDISKIKRIEELETKEFNIESNLTNYLNDKLDSIGIRMHQIRFQESLPEIEYPPIYMYEPLHRPLN